MAGSIVLAVLLPLAGSAEACKYSVRDVGFVNSRNAGYRLVVFVENDGDAAFAKAARDGLAQSNVVVAVVVLSKEPDHPAVRAVEATGAAAMGSWLIGPGDRAARLDAEAIRNPSTLVDSPTRQLLAKRLPAGFATVVLVDGDDPAENSRAAAAVATVVERVSRIMGKLEKSAKEPPGFVRIAAEGRDRERWLLWGLGVDDPKRATAAFVFGQFRRGASLFVGDEIDPVAMFAPIATLGYSCECNLDRESLFGPSLPHRWTDDERKRTFAASGFNPDDPQVRAEVNAILAKKPLIEAGELKLSFEELLLGIKETPLDEDDAPASKAPAAVEAPRAAESATGRTSPDADRRQWWAMAALAAAGAFGVVWVVARRGA